MEAETSQTASPWTTWLPDTVTQDVVISVAIVLTLGVLSIAALAALIIGLSSRFKNKLALQSSSMIKEGAMKMHRFIQRITIFSALTAAVVLIAALGFALWKGIHPTTWIYQQLAAVSLEKWTAIALDGVQILGAGILLLFILRAVRSLVQKIATYCIAWENLRDNDKSLERFFLGLQRCIGITSWLAFFLISWSMIDGPELIFNWVFIATKIYLIISLGILIIRASAVVVDTAEGLSNRYAEKRNWLAYYAQLRPLVPLLRRCLELALWVGIASLVVLQLDSVASIAHYGPRIIAVIGIFFCGRVAMELGNFYCTQSAQTSTDVDDMTARRRATIMPLMRSILRFACYFVVMMLSLSVLGFNTMPFLAGFTALGMVVGFGAQSLITDVVSGFFILFENVYLVGDVIEGGGAKGTVDAIEFRTTRIRDEDGKLHIIRNGDMKQIVNYSREFTKAVVTFEVSYEKDIHAVFSILQQCGQELRASNPNVLDDLHIDGITGFGGQTLTLRTTVRVKPGTHEIVAAHLRLKLKEAFDRITADPAARKSLVPEKMGAVLG
jgi:moderate conductance mechanosensitive channel